MFSEFWAHLPASIKIVLLQGTSRRDQLLHLARLCLRESENSPRQSGRIIDLTALASDFLLAAWEADPLNGRLASDVLKIFQTRLPQPLYALLHSISMNFAEPKESRALEEVISKGDFEQEAALVLAGRKAEPGNLFWALRLWNLGWRDGQTVYLEQAIAALEQFSSLLPLAALLKAKVYMLRAARIRAESLNAEWPHEQLEAALNCLTEINNPDCGAWLAPLMLKNHLLALLGEGAASREAGLAVLRARPWQISLGLKLYDQLFNQDTGKLPPGKTTLLLYTWNKADDLERTFSALAPGAGLLHKIVALNNGSSDHTAAVLASWSEKLANRLEVISLPVNTGAPAARNWLRSSEAVSASDFAVFLDDDALLCGAETGRWLKAFGQAISAYPEAAAYGLKITDYASPHCCQSADLHVLCKEDGQALLPAAKTAEMIISGEQISDYPPGHSHSLNRAHERSFELVNPALGAADLGLFDYIRPCASVTGCCHLFRTEKLLTHGGFNLSFSPSQCDDAERDLRLAVDGHFACYNGLGSAWHLQRTGRGRKMNPAAYGSSIANHYKLSAYFDQGRVLQIMRHQFKILEQDILRKLEALEQA